MSHDANCPHDHDEDSFAPGSVYQVSFTLPDGIIFRSTPMSGERARDTMELIGAALSDVRGRTTSSRKISEKIAKQLLLSDAAELRKDVQRIDKHLTPEHGHFNQTAVNLLDAADRLEAEAAAIMIAN